MLIKIARPIEGETTKSEEAFDKCCPLSRGGRRRATICGNNRQSIERQRERGKGRKEGEEKFPKHLVSRNVKSLAAKKILAIGIRALRAHLGKRRNA